MEKEKWQSDEKQQQWANPPNRLTLYNSFSQN